MLQSRTVPQGCRCGRAAAIVVLALLAGVVRAESGTGPADSGTAGPLYRPGEGLRLGNSGLALGGHAIGEIEELRDDDHYSEGGANVFLFYTPVSFLRLFADLEVPDAGVERAHLELSANDALNLRVGKLLTPFGRWNVQHIEPLVWTTSEPFLVETMFDDTVSGGELRGSVFPEGGALSYSVFGSMFDPINADPDEAFAEQLAGAHLEWASLAGWTLGGSYLGSRQDDGHWNHLGGIDWLWQPNSHFELSGEFLVGRGSRRAESLWAGYVQVARETFPGLYAVFRYERVVPAEIEPFHLVDAGLAWVPVSYLRFKMDYLHVDRVVAPSEPGLRASISFLF